jgi:hypothetical protein
MKPLRVLLCLGLMIGFCGCGGIYWPDDVEYFFSSDGSDLSGVVIGDDSELEVGLTIKSLVTVEP